MPKPPPYSPEMAETLAVRALAFIAEDDSRLGSFVAATGIAPQSMREAAREPNFLAGVLKHILAEENLLIAFAESGHRSRRGRPCPSYVRDSLGARSAVRDLS